MVKSELRVRLSLTDAGRMLLWGTVLSFLTAIAVPAFGVLSALIAVLVTAWFTGWIVRPRVRIVGHVPETVVVGHPVQVRYVIRNTARVPVYDLHVEFPSLPAALELVTPAEVISRLASEETTEVTITILPRRRGYHQLSAPVCRSSFPFNLMNAIAICNDERTLTVLPVFYPLQMVVRGLSRHVRTGGSEFKGRTDVSPEYAGNRPFLPGDSPRRIDTRAWARLSVPATKEYHNDSDSFCAIVLDSRFPVGVSPSPDGEVLVLEAAVSLCASVAFTLNRKSLVDFLVTGSQLHEYPSWPRAIRLNKMHEVLAGVEGDKDYSLEEMAPILAERFYEMSEVIFILLRWDHTYWRLLEQAARAGCHSTVLLVTASDEMQELKDDTKWADVVRVVSPDDILSGHLERI